jgi:hypothetical protein
MQIANVAALIRVLPGQVFAPEASIRPLGLQSQFQWLKGQQESVRIDLNAVIPSEARNLALCALKGTARLLVACGSPESYLEKGRLTCLFSYKYRQFFIACLLRSTFMGWGGPKAY